MVNPVCTYDFTASQAYWTREKLETLLGKFCKKWCFQLERGEGGFNHFQGRLSLRVKKRPNEAVQMFGGAPWHLSVTSKENAENDFYVTKEDTRVDGPWTEEDAPKYVPRQVREITKLRPWQEHILEDRNVWDKRTINVVYDASGNSGKSTLCTYLGVYGYGRKLPFANNYKDVMQMVMDTRKCRLYIFDLPRALRKDVLNEFIAGVETLKDGYAFDPRYEFRDEHFDCPNIWIFTNVVPDVELVSRDRWRIWTIDSETLCLVPWTRPEVVAIDDSAIPDSDFPAQLIADD